MATRAEVDRVDQKIIALLQQDGRMSNSEIARRLGVTEGTVRHRVERLLSEGVVRITAVPNPAGLGLEISVIIGVNAEPDKVDDVCRQLAMMKEVRWIAHTAGTHNVVLEGVFASHAELLNFLSRGLGAVPGLMKTDTSHVMRYVRQPHEWRVPDPVVKGEGKKLVLVVDDDPDFVELTSLALQNARFRVKSAMNGSEAVAAMREEKPSLVILDMMVDYLLDSVGVAKVMRSDKDLRDIPILMLSAAQSTEYASILPTSDLLGVDEYVSKPILAADLVSRVKRLAR
jgi:Lrp/AsnC family transcriptional regulator for asnA, asnC and gidA